MRPRPVRRLSTTREPPGIGFNVELHSLPLDGHIVLFPPNGDDGEATRADNTPPARPPEPNRNTQRHSR